MKSSYQETSISLGGIDIRRIKKYPSVLTPEALAFLLALHQQFNERRITLLEERQKKQLSIEQGKLPTFPEETKRIRTENWKVAPLPPDLLDRRVEITGPVDRKMVINALNSGAKVFMADFEDSNTPSWENNMQGQINLMDAVAQTISYTHPNTGKQYKLLDNPATLMVRPRGWHLEEKNLIVEGECLSAALVDFGLFFYHNAKALRARGSGPYFYLPKLENYLEARLWNDVFVFAQSYLDIPQGSIKATVLIETILAAFEIDEILYELRQHSAGLNCGRWDYIFSFIKKFKSFPAYVLPDRAQVNMSVLFMKAYTQLVIKTCHKRGVHAMGGMAAQIPIKNDEQANAAAIEKVRQDKLREVKEGHDGTWVAHPGLVSIAMDVFNEHMPKANQVYRKRDDLEIDAKDLLAVPNGTITEKGLRENINVGILYIESWLRGNGAAAIYHKMEDAATAEISRTQVWQWLTHQAKLDDGRMITPVLYEQLKQEELQKIQAYLGVNTYQQGRFEEAITLFDQLVLTDEYEDFLTLAAYPLID